MQCISCERLALVATEQWAVLEARLMLTALAGPVRTQQHSRNAFWEFVSQDVLLHVITTLGKRLGLHNYLLSASWNNSVLHKLQKV